jgi:hypothetical protein
MIESVPVPYWVEALASVYKASIFLAVASGLITVFSGALSLADDDDAVKAAKVFRVALPIFLLAIAGAVFAPTSNQSRRALGLPIGVAESDTPLAQIEQRLTAIEAILNK